MNRVISKVRGSSVTWDEKDKELSEFAKLYIKHKQLDQRWAAEWNQAVKMLKVDAKLYHVNYKGILLQIDIFFAAGEEHIISRLK